MELERLGRGGEQVGCKQAETLLAHVHLRKLVGKSGHRGLLVCRLLAKSWSIDVLWLLRCTSIIRLLCSRLGLLLRELIIRCETGGEKLGGLSGLSGNGAVCRPWWGSHGFRPVIRLRLACCILPAFWMVGRLRGRGRAWVRVQTRVHAFWVGEGRFPLRPARCSLCRNTLSPLCAKHKLRQSCTDRRRASVERFDP